MRIALSLKLIWNVTVLVALSSSVVRAEPLPVQVDAKAKTTYLPGLPIVVEVTITNTSDKIIETLVPSKKLDSVGAVVRKEGEKENLRPSRHQTYVVDGIQTLQLKPREKASAKLDLNMMFQYPLPVGRYLCTLWYFYGKHYDKVQIAQSAPVLIEIQEPSDTDPGMQQEMRREVMKFQTAQIYYAEHTDPGFDIAYRIFSEITENGTHREYRNVSAYYRAVLEKDPKARLAAYLKYLKNPAADLPDLLEMDDLHRRLGYLYFETGNLQAARESFLKIAEPDNAVRNYLQKIEAASKAP